MGLGLFQVFVPLSFKSSFRRIAVQLYNLNTTLFGFKRLIQHSVTWLVLKVSFFMFPLVG